MAKKIKKTEEKAQVFYVGLRDPIEVRRSILESSKEVVQYLQRAEKFKQIRSEKAGEISKLRETMKEITRLVRKLRADLPKTSLRTPMHKHEQEEKKKEIKQEIKKLKERNVKLTEIKPAIKEEKKMTELEKLESELNEIESRLTSLS